MKHLTSALFAATALVTGAVAAPQSAHANIVVLPDFQIFENPTSFSGSGVGCADGFAFCGTFDVVDNSSIYSIIGFDVGMDDPPGTNGTTRPSWIANTGNVDYGGGPTESFLYFGGEGSENAIGPGTSDDSFTWEQGHFASPIEVFFVDANGAFGSCVGVTGVTGCDAPVVSTPEPTSTGILGLGLAALGVARKRKKA